MKRGLVLVKGQTEERFVNECLAPYLLAKGLLLERPTIVTTKRVAGGSNFKGGISSYGPVQRDLQRLLHDGYAIGLEHIRAVCPHFHQWLGRLEALAGVH
jgi:hypothetical protein